MIQFYIGKKYILYDVSNFLHDTIYDIVTYNINEYIIVTHEIVSYDTVIYNIV